MKRPLRSELSQMNLMRRGVPKKFFNITIDEFKDYGSESLAKVRDLVSEYINNIDEKFNENQGLFIYGANGVGKSLLATLIVIEAYRHRYTSKRTNWIDYITEYTRIWGIKNPEDKEEAGSFFYHDFKAIEFLVLEEVGKEIDNKIAVPILEDCLRYREEKGLPTIICTNMTPKQLVDKYGVSVGSLIKGNFTPIKIEGSDRRKEHYNERVE